MVDREAGLGLPVHDIVVVFWLVILEGLLSVDNALVLAAIASELPKKEQKKALVFGIIGAYAFRVLAVIFAVFLIQLWWFKLVGGLYLLHIGYKGIRKTNPENRPQRTSIFARLTKRGPNAFWMTVINIELMDIAFSVDSILAAVAITEKFWLIIAGGMFGILLMRGVAGMILGFIEKHPVFKKTAYALVIVIGLKLSASPWWHPHESLFFALLAFMFFGSFVIEKISADE